MHSTIFVTLYPDRSMLRILHRLLFSALLLITLPVAAQQQLLLRDAVLKAGTDLAPDRIVACNGSRMRPTTAT